ncbi:MAG: glycosyltransferase family 2 protein, partial [Deltaproteobacteria bacterium]|nr:glycosyltransferase family 2 protein [Deltaproteobacteria bacterium]
MPHQPVSIIIPVYNKWQLTAACLRSLYTHAPRRPFEVIVVDNASRDATVGELPILGYELFGDGFRRIRNADNRNFAGACNQGARAASHEFLFFLNNDTLLTPAWDSPLFAALADDPGLGAVGPLLLFENGTVQHAGVAVQPDRSIRHFYGGIPGLHPLAQKRRKLAFITAAALLIRKKDFFAAGAFYEGYVNGFEDIELCYRLRQAGFTLSVIPESVICHLDGGTRREDPDAPRNAPLLSRRCPALRKPEFHRIALEDGYTVV